MNMNRESPWQGLNEALLLLSGAGAKGGGMSPSLRLVGADTAAPGDAFPADEGVHAIDAMTAAISAQQVSQRATLVLLAELLRQVRANNEATPAPIKAWDFEIERDDSEFKRMTSVRGTPVR